MIQKIQRQLTTSSSAPPSSGPMPRARAETPAQMPSALGRSAVGKTEETMASDSPSSGAAPRPWIRRPATSTSSWLAVAQTAEPSANRPMPIRKTRRRPNMSPSRPAVTTVAASTSR